MDRLFDEAKYLMQILYHHNVSINDLEIFAEWNDLTGMHGESLKDYLNKIRLFYILNYKGD